MSEKGKTVTRLDSGYMKQYDAHMLRQKKKRQRLIRRLVLFAVLFMLVAGSLTTYHFKQRSLEAKKAEEYHALQQKYADLQKKENSLQEQVKLLNDEDYILDIARTNYFFSKKGEVIFKNEQKDPSY
ncbi:septum formation initiator family protein [Virgibacillus sp. 179-BFC.A HS]|uniref:Septum formation initiator family protein n=1 Tax=Tigheibacillus jepli TaxID=3035914 RepID=A0ABU5CCK3_9BACI|nr:septum formation initiator family protein [Virgibacillus sp. 179-BFC.A HS]MDY0404034.1 septum formation initiator family protein [Virgibacillus sp. 179-BFC.A HS]